MFSADKKYFGAFRRKVFLRAGGCPSVVSTWSLATSPRPLLLGEGDDVVWVEGRDELLGVLRGRFDLPVGLGRVFRFDYGGAVLCEGSWRDGVRVISEGWCGSECGLSVYGEESLEREWGGGCEVVGDVVCLEFGLPVYTGVDPVVLEGFVGEFGRVFAPLVELENCCFVGDGCEGWFGEKPEEQRLVRVGLRRTKWRGLGRVYRSVVGSKKKQEVV